MAEYNSSLRKITASVSPAFHQADADNSRMIMFVINESIYNTFIQTYISATEIIVVDNGSLPQSDGLINYVYVYSIYPNTDSDIISLAELKRYLNVNAGDSSKDTFLSEIISQSSRAIEEYCRARFNLQTFTGEIYDGTGEQKLYLRNLPVYALANAAITDIQYRLNPSSSWTTLEDTLENILVKKDSPYSIYLYGNSFPKGIQNVKVSYKAGYQVVPGAVKKVCLEMCAEMYKQSNQGSGRLGQGSRNVSTGAGASGSDSYFELTDKHKQILESFVMPNFIE